MGRIAVAALAGAAGLNLLQHLRLEYQLFT
jgi:hypothetical protein